MSIEDDELDRREKRSRPRGAANPFTRAGKPKKKERSKAAGKDGERATGKGAPKKRDDAAKDEPAKDELPKETAAKELRARSEERGKKHKKEKDRKSTSAKRTKKDERAQGERAAAKRIEEKRSEGKASAKAARSSAGGFASPTRKPASARRGQRERAPAAQPDAPLAARPAAKPALARPGRIAARASEPARPAPVSPAAEDVRRLRAALEAEETSPRRVSSRPAARRAGDDAKVREDERHAWGEPAAPTHPWGEGASELELIAPPVVNEVAPLDDEEAEALRADHPGFWRPDVQAQEEDARAPAPAIEVAELELSMPPPPPRDTDQLYEVEATIERLVSDVGAIASDPAARKRAAAALAEVAAHLGGEAKSADKRTYYDEQWAPDAMRGRADDVDDFGLDRRYEERLRALFEALYTRWFRVRMQGAENVPARGRAMLVANHGGALPWDGIMLRTGLRLSHPSARQPRWLAEDVVFHTPFLGAFVNRVGAVRACPENAERLLEREQLVAVFPEGEKGAGKLFSNRYELQRFGRGGYVKLALRSKAPIVPVAIVGAEEAHPVLFRSTLLAKVLGLSVLPITPTFPLLGPLGLIPFPSRWVILFGEALDLRDEGFDEAAAEDPVAVARINDRVRGEVQTLVRRALSLRSSAF